MRILSVSPSDIGGGAERVALDLHSYYLTHGHPESLLTSGTFYGHVEGTYHIDNDAQRSTWARAMLRLAPKLKGAHQSLSAPAIVARRALIAAGEPRRTLEVLDGKIDYDFPATASIIADTQPDILQLHNLHGSYFDLRKLPCLSASQPTVFTAHDTWMASGHCAYSIDCENWVNGAECEPCPYLEYPPALRKDNAHFNFVKKQKIFESMPGQIHLVAPALWVSERLEQSILEPALSGITLIPNGVNQDIFKPIMAQEKQEMRKKLGIEQESFCLIFTLASANNPYKDVSTLTNALEEILRLSNKKLTFIILGGTGEREVTNSLTTLPIAFSPDPYKIAEYIQASDLYVHAARAEVHPLAILEAQSCGIPAVITDTGGSRDAIKVNASGLLVAEQDPSELAQAILSILENPAKHADMAQASLEFARPYFSIDRMAQDYLKLYEELLSL